MTLLQIVIYVFTSLLVVFLLVVLMPDTKYALAKKYGVGTKALSNWVKHYCKEIDYKEWNDPRLKRLSLKMNYYLFNYLGFPDKSMTLTKKELVTRLETYPRMLLENVTLLFLKKGYAVEASKGRKFPPRISDMIINHFG